MTAEIRGHPSHHGLPNLQPPFEAIFVNELSLPEAVRATLVGGAAQDRRWMIGRRTPILRGDLTMNATVEQVLITKIKALSPQQVAEVVDFVEFLAAKSAKRAAFDRLLAIAPALEAAGVEPMSEDDITAEVKAARAARRAQLAASAAKDAGANRS
ncbi:MAG: DUF2281 domain-containing protein [Proteobacteria bacterium]|nr:DUF2281 domain-containing protein [Pseudomonadota bacterium]